MNHKQRQSGTRDAADRVRLKKINQVDAQGRCNEGARAAMAMKLRLFIAIIWARHPSLSRRGPDLNNILSLHLEIKSEANAEKTHATVAFRAQGTKTLSPSRLLSGGNARHRVERGHSRSAGSPRAPSVPGIRSLMT